MRNDKPVKPPKPYPEFPLFAHNSGKWAKKSKGKLVYFGRWDDPDGALKEYEQSLAPPAPSQPTVSVLTVADACNHFLAAKRSDCDSGQLSPRSFNDYKRTCKRMAKFWGRERSWGTLEPSDFTAYRAMMLETCNPVSTGNEVTRIKTMINWLTKSKFIDQCDVGPDFKKPSAKVARGHRRAQGKKLYTPEQIKLLLDESGIHMRAMILLGINCGYGNNDCNKLPLSVAKQAVDTGWIEFHRPKTEIDRRCPLWPETRKALKRSLARRVQCKVSTAFVMANGKSFSAENNDIAKRFRVARLAANIKKGGYYWLRHSFATIAGGSKDQVAVNAIMGHVDPTIASTYREEIEDKRLVAVTNIVRQWLFKPKPA